MSPFIGQDITQEKIDITVTYINLFLGNGLTNKRGDISDLYQSFLG
jgi:hypothetical protein